MIEHQALLQIYELQEGSICPFNPAQMIQNCHAFAKGLKGGIKQGLNLWRLGGGQRCERLGSGDCQHSCLFRLARVIVSERQINELHESNL